MPGKAPLQGRLLIAPPALRDPNFARSVVLMVQHGEQGGLGLILNRPTQVAVESAWGQISESPCHIDQMLLQGGPCQGPLMALHTHAQAGEVPVIQPARTSGGKLLKAVQNTMSNPDASVYFSAQEEHLTWLMDHGQRDGMVRFFVGYAGWSPGQLEAEIEAGGWQVMAPTTTQVFAPQDLWSHLSAEAALGQRLDPRIVPTDPRMN